MARVSNEVMNEAERASTREARWRGALLGLTPLLCLTLVAAAALGFAPVVRALLVSQGFFVELDAEVAVLAGGLALAAGVYGATLVRSLRRVGHWHRAGLASEASAALVALAATGVIVALPVILAFVIPQQPAP
ncbi:MAG: hypothetical protein ACXVCX_00395 [Ktedonobacterales bacterium]